MKKLLSLLLISLLALECTRSTDPASGPVILNIISGDRQEGLQNTLLPQPIIIGTTYANGDPVAGTSLTVSVTQGDGEIIVADSVTDENGRYEFQWQLGEDYVNTVEVSLLDEPEVMVYCRATARYLYAIPEQVDDGWETASLADVGMSVEPMAELMDSIRTGYYEEVHSVLIVKENRLVFEAYFPGHDFGYTGENFLGRYINFDRDTRHNTHSATKSIISAIVGIAIDQGFIPDEDEKIFTYFDSHAVLNVGAKDSITIKHLLTMTSGLQWNEWDAPVGGGENDVDYFNNSSDPIYYFLSKLLLHEPGTTFYYNGGGVDILGEIVTRATGVRVDRFADEHLFGPLGITNYVFQRLPNGLMACHGDIYIRPRDLAKFGFLYLNRGVWQGQRIVSEAWVQKSVAPTVSLFNWHLYWADDYGYLWWMKDYYHNGNTYSSFKALGWGGQEIMVFPDSEMVVVFTGANYMQNPPCDELLMRFIFYALN